MNSLLQAVILLRATFACAPPSAWPSMDTAYWLAGAIAEVSGALFALTGIFVIYKLQTIDHVGAKGRYFGKARMAQAEAMQRWGLVWQRYPADDQPMSRPHDLECRSHYEAIRQWLQGLGGHDERSDVRVWAGTTLIDLKMSADLAEAADHEYERCKRLAIATAAVNGFTILAALTTLLAAEAIRGGLGAALVVLFTWTVLAIAFNVWSIATALRDADKELRRILAAADEEVALVSRGRGP